MDRLTRHELKQDEFRETLQPTRAIPENTSKGNLDGPAILVIVVAGWRGE